MNSKQNMKVISKLKYKSPTNIKVCTLDVITTRKSSPNYLRKFTSLTKKPNNTVIFSRTNNPTI